jgi:FkbM family methyltransferase
MKNIKRSLPWTTKVDWAWPDEDEKFVQVFGHVADIDYIMQFVDSTDVCVQAGGACGVWPMRFSMFFGLVFTFEPMPENYECLKRNIKGYINIMEHNFALSDRFKKGSMKFDRTEHNNYGAVYFDEGEGSVESMPLDALCLDACDLIQLDIEGHELEALKGSIHTITKFKPTIVLEEKPLPQLSRDYKMPRYFLQDLGYKEVGKVHKDIILTC